MTAPARRDRVVALALAGYAAQVASLAPVAWALTGGTVADAVWLAAAWGGVAGAGLMIGAGGWALVRPRPRRRQLAGGGR